MLLVVAGGVLAVSMTVWRMSGGVFEDPREDDVVSFVILGSTVVLGAYSVVAFASIALG